MRKWAIAFPFGVSNGSAGSIRITQSHLPANQRLFNFRQEAFFGPCNEVNHGEGSSSVVNRDMRWNRSVTDITKSNIPDPIAGRKIIRNGISMHSGLPIHCAADVIAVLDKIHPAT